MKLKKLLASFMAACMIVTAVPVTTMAASYTDVAATDWYYQPVTWASEEGIMHGATETAFAPETNATRGEIVYALHQMADTPEMDKVAPFIDVTSNMDCADAVAWAAENKVVSGYDAQTFGPADPVTREQMSAILYRFAKHLGYDTTAETSLQVFSDFAKVDAYAVDAMEWSCAEGLFSGMGDGTLNPDGFITRAQVASILYRYDVKLDGDTSEDVVADDNEDKDNKEFTVTFDLNYGDEDAEEVTVEEGDTVDEPDDPSRSKYRFRGWYTKASGGEKFDFDTEITEDITLYAHWQKKGSGGGGGSSSPSHTHAYGNWESNDDGTHSKVCANSGCNAETVTEDCKYKESMTVCDVCGYEDGNYHIATVDMLLAFAKMVNDGEEDFAGETVLLEADIDLNGVTWTPIGTNADSNKKFKGTFDGQCYTISNLTVDTTAEPAYQATGFFGALNGTVQNLTFENANINGLSAPGSTGSTDNGIAVVAGSIYDGGSIDNVDVIGATVAGNRYVGGIAGYVYGNVTNCYVEDITLTATPDNLTGSYDNGDKAGAIAGYYSSKNTYEISDNMVIAAVINAYRDAGGVVGTADGADSVKDNTVMYVTINIDQTSDKKYDAKTPNAGAIVGRITSGTLDDSNDSSDVSINYKLQGVTEEAVAMVGSTTYASLEAAAAAVADGGKIILLKEVKLADDLTVDKSFTIDGSGKSFDANTKTVETTNGAVITYSNVFFTNDIAVEGSHTFESNCSYDVNVGVTLSDKNSTVDTVTFKDKYSPYYKEGSYNDTLIVNGEYVVFNGEKLEALIDELDKATIILHAVEITNDEIIVGSGKDIVVKGWDDSTVFDGQFQVTGKLTVKNLTVTNESATNTGISKKIKNAFYVQGEGVLTCEGVTFEHAVEGKTLITSWWSSASTNPEAKWNNVILDECTFNCYGQRPLQIAGEASITNCTFNDPYRYVAQLTSGNNESDTVTITFENNTINKTVDNGKPVYGLQLTSDYGNENMVIEGSGNKINRTTVDAEGNAVTYADYLYAWEAGTGLSNGFVDIATITLNATDGELVCINATGDFIDLGTYYAIMNLDGLKAFAAEVNGGKDFADETVILVADIDLNDAAWTPIGATKDTAFRGTFDGNEKTISNLNVAVEGSYAGLFGFTPDATLKNINVDNATVKGASCVGTIAGYAYTGKVENCHVTGDIAVEGNYKVGGITGGGYAKVIECSVTGDNGSYVKGVYTDGDNLEGDNVGGIIGFTGEKNDLTASVSDCSVENVDVSGTRKVGGVVGYLERNVAVEECSFEGTVTCTADETYAAANAGKLFVGGIAGEVKGQVANAITDCTVESGTVVTGLETASTGAILGGSRNDLSVVELKDNKYDGVVVYVMIVDGLMAAGEAKYTVSNANGLAKLNEMMADESAGRGAVVNITDDIDFTGYTWTPVDSHVDTNFTLAEINGNGNIISNLTIDGQAMFKRFVGSGDVVIKDITFDNATVTSEKLNSSILTVQSYQNVLLDNVDVTNSKITGAYKVAPLIATVYNESSSTVTATLKDCDVTNCTVTATSYDFCTAGMVAFVYEGDNDKIEFENCTVTNVKLIAPDDDYEAHAAIYTAGSGVLYDEADGVTVTNVTFEKLS